MKLFHISDVLSATTGRLVSSRHMDGIYEILNFLTGDNLFTHQLPRAMKECELWLRTQFPTLFVDDQRTAAAIERLERLMVDGDDRVQRGAKIAQWVEALRVELELPEILPVYEMGADMHTKIDPIEEARAMFGDDKVIGIHPES